MSPLVIVAGVAAVLAFWAIGAYNRLIRLRAQALRAFNALLVPLRRTQALAESFAAPASHEPAAEALAPETQQGALQAAAWQFGVSIAAAQARPLEAHAMRSLGAAEAVLRTAWERHCTLQRGGDEAAASPGAAQALEWQAIAAQQAHALSEFDRAAARYNEALLQFPASIVASLFRLREAGSWRP